ncbi:hypothetical protein DMB92_03185 [Campylobacter sp. MIT 99-7217]|uniref:hypothetical protein n=1 Tax=Campylobacter sp. MIT 99-7217 TaxID=535091 RepID=UPI001158C3AB|nr:hypothetical protein [Campylobacter sp. MIT 99-7217]TQR32981.1 hypothetical protein DMB92_03185 [Campylobacter sp. MIT 99-7217]
MKKLILFILLIFLFACSKKQEQIQQRTWKNYDKNISKMTKSFKDEADFQDMLNASLAGLLERGNSEDKTISYVDYASQNLKIENINLLFEDEKSSLMFQKEIFINNNFVNYSGGLVNRLELGKGFIFGVNGFLDKYEEREISSYGGELGFGEFFKAYTNTYYIEEENKGNTQVGMSFVLPKYKALGLDLSVDKEKTNYTLHYAPYKVFNIALSKKKFNDPLAKDLDYIFLGFEFNYYKSIFKQLHKSDYFEEVNRYDFLKRKYY